MKLGVKKTFVFYSTEFWQSNRELRAKQLLSQIQAMYRRSDIPEVERPWFPRTADPELIKTVRN